MACSSVSGNAVLFEAKTFQQARERTYLQWLSECYPCRMKMKKAGWFAVRNKDGEFVAVCLYCKKAFIGWNNQHDPYKVHEVLSPECVFVLYAQNIHTPTSPILESLPRREEVRPSLHNMAELPKRTRSFEQWPYGSPHPPADALAEAGLFYIGQNTIVECFYCHGQISISRPDDNVTLAHTDQCKYAKHLRNDSQRIPLDIQASNKIYKLVDISKNNTIFYILKCINASTPGIFLSALVPLPNECELQTSDRFLKQLQRNAKLTESVNWVTSSDGALVNILKELARNPEDLTIQPADIKCLIETPSILSTDRTYDSDFQCKACLTIDASPHVVSIKCGHRGLCFKECFPKWMTCVVCGYTLGKAIRIRGV